MSGSRIEALTTETFDTAVSDGVVLVGFKAPWCMPCRMLEPVLEQLAHTFAGRLRVLSVDTDRQPDLAKRFKVRAVPTLLLMRRGETVRRFVGLTTFERLAIAIQEDGLGGPNAAETGS